MKPLLVGAALIITSTAAAAPDLAITDVAVVNTRSGAVTQHCTVLIHRDRIAFVGKGAPPQGAQIKRATGMFLIPGLWDMVTHLSWTRASAMPVLVANGITAVRDQGGNLAETAVWAAAVKSGRLQGPTIFQVGPMLNGKSFNRFQYALGSAEQARGAVRVLKFLNLDGLEIERRVPRDVYFALMAEARAAGLPVGGKVPLEITPTEPSNAGQATIDNLETIYDGTFRAAHEHDMAHAMDAFLAPSGDADKVFATFKKNRTAVTPSVAILAYSIAHNNPAAAHDPLDRYVAKSQRKPPKPIPANDLAEFKAMLPRLMTTIARLQTDGVTLLAGTDVAGDRVPGFSLHNELHALATAALTPLQVLQDGNAKSGTGDAAHG